MSFFFFDKLHAKIKISYLGDLPSKDISRFSETVGNRTSIQLSNKIEVIPRFSESILENPWVWVGDLSLLYDKDGKVFSH